ncbi:MAG TPA: rod shape-determining protein MreC [Pirellulales bacterium]|jgi:cell shape-determining protein MreC|nr:rod shape-determining protein MreC [Pirellulales bacterium]
MFEPRRNVVLTAPAAQLAAIVALALALAMLPAPRVAALKALTGELFAPGQRRVAGVREWTARQIEVVALARATAEEHAILADELRRERLRNSELEAALALSRPAEGDDPPDDALVLAGLVRARVLGRQARAFLDRADIIDCGGDEGLARGDLILADERPIVDQGADVGLAVDDLALAGRRVWGRLDEVGQHTASVRRATDRGFRDVVRLAQGDGVRRRATARGVLEGTGEALARVRMVASTEPVSVGDYVLADAVSGALSAPLIYGRVVRVDREPGKTHWEIWMEPAVGPDEPTAIAVLRLSLNPERVGYPQAGAPLRLNKSPPRSGL